MTHGSYTCMCIARYRRPTDFDGEDDIPGESCLEETADKGLYFNEWDNAFEQDEKLRALWSRTIDERLGFMGDVSYEAEMDDKGEPTGRMAFVLTVPRGSLRKIAEDEMARFRDVFSRTTVDEFCGAKVGDFYELAKMVGNDGWQDSICDISEGGHCPEPWFSWIGLNLRKNDGADLKYRVVAIFGVDHD